MTNTTMPERNNEGFLEDARDWTEDVAATIAAEDGMELTEKHWEIIGTYRKFVGKHIGQS